MENISESLKTILENDTSIKLMMALIEENIINPPKYEYIEVYQSSFWDRVYDERIKGIIVEGTINEKIPDTNIISVLNQLGNNGWKVVNVIHKIEQELDRDYYDSDNIPSISMPNYRITEQSTRYSSEETEKSGYQEFPVTIFNNTYIYILERKITSDSAKELYYKLFNGLQKEKIE